MTLAKDVTKREGIKWETWTAQYIPNLNERTRQRYMKLGKLDFEDVKAKGLDKVYKLLFGDGYAKKKASLTPKTASVPEEGKKPKGLKTQRLKEAFDNLTDLTTAPDDWKEEIEANKSELANLAYALLGLIGSQAKIGASGIIDN